jgi:hypothetical protein
MPDLKTKLPTQKHFTNQPSNASKPIPLHWSTSRHPDPAIFKTTRGAAALA